MSDVEFQVLGTSVVLVDGMQLRIDAPKQRGLLTLLVIHANEVLPTDRILDALWGEQPPAGGVKTLRYHVSKLRSALGSHADLIVSRESGYELVVPLEAIDSRRFEALLAKAQEAAAADPIGASELCHHALELWRGPAFADFPYEEFVQAEARRLDELRLGAIELRIEALVVAGQDANLVPELESLVAEHPLRENLWSQLMVVLYRSGRQPEALRAYQRACRVFGELGTEPSDDLAALEGKILLRDPTLLPEAQQVKGNLPAMASHFVGRAEEMTALRDLVSGNRLVNIVGPGGVGKTRLAIEIARDLEERFSGGVWLVEYAAIDDPGLVPSQVASALSVLGSAQGRDALDHVADYFGTSEALLVIDNCEHLVDSIAPLISTLLTRCPQLRVLATSRRPLTLEGETLWRAVPLSISAVDATGEQPEALQLFIERARASQPDFTLTAEAEVLAIELCTRLAGLPLAIELAAARLRMMSLEQLASRLDEAFALLAGGPKDKPDHQQGLRALLDWSYELLEPDEQRLFRFTSVFRGGFTLESVEHFLELLGISRYDAWDLVGALVDNSLVSMTADDRYTMLEPIREYGLLLLGDNSETETARDLHLAVLRGALYIPETIIAPQPAEIPDVSARFSAEIDNARAAVAWALDSPDPSAALEFGSTVSHLLSDGGMWVEAHSLRERLLAATSEPSAHRAKVLRDAVYATAAIEGFDNAVPLVDELAATAEALDDDVWRAITVDRYAAIEFLRGDTASAYKLWEDAADRLSSIGSSLAWKPLAAVFEAACVIGDFSKARQLASRMHDNDEAPGHVKFWFLGGGAFAAAAEGDVEAAEELLERWEAELPPGELELRNVGDIYALIALARMDLDAVEQRATAILEQDRRNQFHYEIYFSLVMLGLVHFHRGDKQVARRYCAEGLADCTRLGLRGWQRYFLVPHAATVADDAPDLCLTLLAAIEAANRRDRGGSFAGVAEIADQAAAEARSMLTPDEIARAEERGAGMELDDAIDLALSVG